MKKSETDKNSTKSDDDDDNDDNDHPDKNNLNFAQELKILIEDRSTLNNEVKPEQISEDEKNEDQINKDAQQDKGT